MMAHIFNISYKSIIKQLEIEMYYDYIRLDMANILDLLWCATHFTTVWEVTNQCIVFQGFQSAFLKVIDKVLRPHYMANYNICSRYPVTFL